MLVARNGQDRRLFRMAAAVEKMLAQLKPRPIGAACHCSRLYHECQISIIREDRHDRISHRAQNRRRLLAGAAATTLAGRARDRPRAGRAR